LLVLWHVVDIVEHQGGFLDFFDHFFEVLVLIEQIIEFCEQPSAFGVVFDFGFDNFGVVEIVKFGAVEIFVSALCAECFLLNFVSDFGENRGEVFFVGGLS
jgi:hypothetical protein